MGKKKVIKQSSEEVLKQADAVAGAVARASSKSVSKKIESGRIYINASYNNTVITVTNDRGDVLAWSSSGTLGFNGPKKSTPFAAGKVVSAIAEKLRKSGPHTVSVFIKGVGTGRDSALRSLANQGFNILSIKDVTPIPHNGPRPKKARRL